MMFGFYRLAKFAATSYLMIDNIEIFRVENGGGQEPSTTAAGIAIETTTIDESEASTTTLEPETTTMIPILTTTITATELISTAPIEISTTTIEPIIITTTKVVEESSTTAAEHHLNKIYECMFDESEPVFCGAEIKPTGTTHYLVANSVMLHNYKVTDVTSISKLI
jgi:hypothetical protein